MSNETAREEARSRMAVVTGASSGIGLAAAEELARRGWTLALVGRDHARLAEALARVRALGTGPAEALRCDFAVLDDVRQLAARLRESYARIDVLANNAGGTIHTRQSTVDGFEKSMQINHLAPFLLSHELRQALRGGRIINTASMAHMQGRLDPGDLSSSRQPYIGLVVYGSTKQANILFAAEAARRWPDILSTSFHPGVVRTRFGAGNPFYTLFYRFVPFLRTPAKGADTLIWLACADADAIHNGAYYMDRTERRPGPKTSDPALAARLWDASVAALSIA